MVRFPSFDEDGNPRAFLWQNGVMYDLNSLAPGSPLFLLDAPAINSSGEIAGFGVTSRGDVHAFLATPRQGEAASESLEPVAVVDGMTRRMVLSDDARKLLEQRLPFGRPIGQR